MITQINRLVLLAVPFVALAACSGNDASTAQSTTHQATTGRDAGGSSATTTSPDAGRKVPDGTLAWKVIFTGHQSEANVKGADADIAKATTDVHWVTNGHAKVFGMTGGGALDRAGNVQDLSAATSVGPGPVAAIAKKCGDDQHCAMAAMVKLRNDPKAMAAMDARAQAVQALQYRMDQWINYGPNASDLCHLETSGTETSNWNGGARFAGARGIITIAYSARDDIKGNQQFDCDADDNLGIPLKADPVVKVYDLSMPAVTVKTSTESRFTTSGPGPNATDHSSESIRLPAITVKGQPYPATWKTLHGEVTLHDVGSIPASKRLVHLHSNTNASRDMYAVAKERPAIPLDARVSWTFTPAHN